MGYLNEDGSIESIDNEYLSKLQVEKEYRSGNRKVNMFESDGGEQFDQEKLDKLNADLQAAQKNASTTGRESGIEKSVNVDTSGMESEILWQKKLSEGKVPYYNLEDPKNMDRFAGITKARIVERANRYYNGDLDSYYTNVEAKVGSEFLPEEMQAEFAAQSQSRISEDVLQTFYESNTPEEISKSTLLQDTEKKLKGAITQANKQAVKERSAYFDGIDAQVSDLTENISEKENYIAKMDNIPDAYFYEHGMSRAEGVAAEQAKLEELKIELAGIQSQKDFFFKLEKNPEQAIAEEFGDMPNVPGETGMEKARNLFHMYLEGYSSNVVDVEPLPSDGVAGAIEKGLEKWFNVDQKQDLDKLYLDIQALAPIALLNRGPISENDNAWDVYGKTFVTSLIPSTKKNLSTSQEVMQRAEKSLALMQVSPEDITTGAADRVSEIASPYDPYSSKDWAAMGGTTTAIMAELMVSNAMMNPVLNATRLGKFVKSLGDAGEVIAKNGDDWMSYLASTKIGSGVVKSTMKGIEEGAKFEIAGELFPHAEDELNFFSGAFGAALASPLNTVIDDKLKKYILNQYARVFGSKTDDAVEATKLFGKYMEDKLGDATLVTEGIKLPARGAAEVMEEFGNELGNIYRDSDNFKEVITGLEDRFGDLSETMHFAVSSFVMGTAFGAATSVGALNLGKSKSYYEKLSDSERVQFNEFITEYKDEMLQAQEEFVKSKENEGMEGDGSPATDTQAAGTTDEAAKDGEGVPVDDTKPVEEPTTTEDQLDEGDASGDGRKVKDYIDSPIMYNGKEATLKQDGQRVVIEQGNQIIDVDNIDDLSESSLTDIGVDARPEVKALGENKYELRDNTYVNPNAEPEKAIKYDKDGNVKSVHLVDEKGNKRTFRGFEKDDLAYNILLEKVHNEKRSEEFGQFLDEELTSTGEVKEPTTTEATSVDTEVPKKIEEFKESIGESKRIADSVPVFRDALDGDILDAESGGTKDYVLQKQGDGIVVVDGKGKEVKSGKNRAEVLSKYKDNYDYNDGKTIEEVDPDFEGSSDPNENESDIASKSENSEEVVQHYKQRNDRLQEGVDGLESGIDGAIASVIGHVDEDSFHSQGGGEKLRKESTTVGMVFGYFNGQGKGQTMDQIAQSASEALGGDYAGETVAVEDVVNFILANPNGAEQYKRESMKDETLNALADRFKQLTGMELTDDIIDRVVGDRKAGAKKIKGFAKDANDFLDNLEAQLFDKSVPFMKIIPDIVMKGVIESMRGAIAAGKEIALALEAGRQALLNSDWYKEQTKAKKKKARQDFEERMAGINKQKPKEVPVEKPKEPVVESKPKETKEAPKEAASAPPKKSPPKQKEDDASGGKMKERQFNKTIAETLPDTELGKMADANRLFYEVVGGAKTVEAARKWIESKGGVESMFTIFINGGEEISEREALVAMSARLLLVDHYRTKLDEALRNNDSSAMELRNKLNAMRKNASEAGTIGGRVVQQMAHWKLSTPLGVLYDLEQKIKEYNTAKEKSSGINPNTLKEIDEVSKKLAEEIEALKKQVAKEMSENVKLQKTIKSLLESGANLNPNSKTDSESGNTKKKSRRAPVTKEKMREAKESLKKHLEELRKRRGSMSSSFIGLTSEDIELLGKIAVDIARMGFIATKDIINKVNEELVSYGMTFDIKDIESAVEMSDELKVEQAAQMEKLAKKAVKDNTKLINDIIRDHFSMQELEARSLAEKLSEEAGLTGDEAAMLEDMVMKEMKSKIKAKSQAAMTKAIGTSRLKQDVKPKKIIDKMIDMVSLGAMDDSLYRGLFSEQFGLIPNLTNEQSNKVKELAENVQSQVAGSIFFNMAVKEMAAYMHELVPRGKWDVFFDVWVGSMYANMLSGPTTSLVNLGSVESHKRMEVFGDLVNMYQHVQAIKKSSKESRNTKEFLQGLVAFSAIPNFYYRHLASISGLAMGRGVLDAAQVYDKGGTSSKYIEMLNKTNELGSNELERKKHKGLFSGKERHRFLGGYLNPFNLLKFSGRNLEAQDSFERAMLEDRYLGEMVRKAYAEQGLRGKELHQSTVDALKGNGIDIDFILAKVDSEAEIFNEKTGKKITSREKKIRRNELIREAIRDVAGVDSDMEADIVNTADIGVFTGDRHGAIARFAQALGVISNSHWSLKIATIGHIPFTKVVGNVSEFMMDAFPVYGLSRAYGYSVTGFGSRIRHKNWKASELAEKSAQAAAPGTLAHQKQMARAWLGTAASGLAYWIFGVDDDDEDPTDNYFFLSGANREGADYGDSNSAYTPYTLKIGDSFQVDYRMFPNLVIPLALIGNYNDNKLNKNRYSDDEKENAKQLSERAALAKIVAMQTMGVVFDLSFTEGVEELLQISVDMDLTSGGYATTRKLTEKDDFSFTERKLLKAGIHLVTGAMPQNNNLLRQIEKVYDPSSYSQKDVEGILMYSLGIEKFTGINANVDILGNHITSLPGKKTLDLDEYFRDPVDLELREFLTEYGAYPSKPTNPSISWGNNEWRKMNADEFYVFTRICGDSFKSMLENYVNDIDPKVLKDRSNNFKVVDRAERTFVQDDIDKRFDYARKHARDMVRALVRSGGFQSEYDRLLAEGEAALDQ